MRDNDRNAPLKMRMRARVCGEGVEVGEGTGRMGLGWVCGVRFEETARVKRGRGGGVEVVDKIRGMWNGERLRVDKGVKCL